MWNWLQFGEWEWRCAARRTATLRATGIDCILPLYRAKRPDAKRTAAALPICSATLAISGCGHILCVAMRTGADGHNGETAMSKTSAAVWGGLIGALSAAAVSHLLGPARDTVYDERYQSRLDYALSEGERAGAAREQELLSDFHARKLALATKPPVPEKKSKK